MVGAKVETVERERERKKFCIFQDGEDRFTGGFERNVCVRKDKVFLEMEKTLER